MRFSRRFLKNHRKNHEKQKTMQKRFFLVQEFVYKKLNEGLIKLYDKIPYSYDSYVINELNLARNQICNPQLEERIHKIKIFMASF